MGLRRRLSGDPDRSRAHGGAEFLRGWSEAFDDFGIQAEEMIGAGDSVVVLLRQWGSGRQTGAATESRTWQVFDFRDGKIVHCRGYETRAEALDAAGADG